MMEVLQIATGLVGLTGASWLATYALQSIHDRIYDRFWQWRNAVQSHKAREQELRLASIRILQPDANGRGGVAYDGRVYRDLDSRAVFTQELNLFFDPLLERMNAIQKTALAIQASLGTAQRRQLVDEVTEVASQVQ